MVVACIQDKCTKMHNLIQRPQNTALLAVENVTQTHESFWILFGESQKMLSTKAAALLLKLVCL